MIYAKIFRNEKGKVEELSFQGKEKDQLLNDFFKMLKIDFNFDLDQIVKNAKDPIKEPLKKVDSLFESLNKKNILEPLILNFLAERNFIPVSETFFYKQ